MYAFIILLAVVITVYYMMSLSTTNQTEGFKADEVKRPVENVVKRLASLPENPKNVDKKDNQDPSPSPSSSGSLPVAPYQEIAATNPLPYQDTTQTKANRQQLVNALEMLKSFLAFEAGQLEDRSDPAIQLPLQNARSDFYMIQNEVSVLNRNPGVQPTVTLTQLNDIGANLAFLQNKARQLSNAGSLQGPVNAFAELFQNQDPPAKGKIEEGFQSQALIGQRATLKELEDFLAKLQGEILRLSASGTTDPVVQKRVSLLTNMRQDISQIIEQLKSKKMLPDEVPILSSDLAKAFPILGKPSEPLPQLLEGLQLPAGLANALPSNLQNDPTTTREISKLMDKYADKIVNGISATFQVSYHPPKRTEKVRRAESRVDQTGFPSMVDLDNISQSKFMPREIGYPITDRLAPLPRDAGRGPSQFDWKERAHQIEGQIRKRGLRPDDFGLMPTDTKVSNDFSWKGYAKMMCTRLQATMDPALPETCGCPPMDWKGWRNSK
jgi:hypothetical protein